MSVATLERGSDLLDTSTFAYDGDCSRGKKTEGGETVIYVNRYYEKNLTTGTVTTYYYLGGRLVALRKGTDLRYLHQDHLTGTSLTIDDQGNEVASIKYYPYGETRSSSGTLDTDKKFTGQRLDGTGLYYYGARMYDPEIGRFISADILVPEPANPQAFNRYGYVLSNPLKYVDPTGRAIWVPRTDPYTGIIVDPPPPEPGSIEWFLQQPGAADYYSPAVPVPPPSSPAPDPTPQPQPDPTPALPEPQSPPIPLLEPAGEISQYARLDEQVVHAYAETRREAEREATREGFWQPLFTALEITTGIVVCTGSALGEVTAIGVGYGAGNVPGALATGLAASTITVPAFNWGWDRFRHGIYVATGGRVMLTESPLDWWPW